MTATGIELHNYLETLRATVPYVHPAAQARLDAWFAEMIDAADIGDAAAFAKIALRVTDKVKLELEWQRQDKAGPTPVITPTPHR